MRRLTVVLLVILTSSMYAANDKTPKSNNAGFETVSVEAPGITGSYRGPTESYGLVLEMSNDGVLRGNYVEMGRVAVLNAIVLNGAAFSARASFDDGSSRTITGSFARRVRGGSSALGIRLHAVPVENVGPVETFFERF